jgi:hypothetical protein
MTTLYLHIGSEKTGTTSVQRFLRANRDLLARHAILFPRAPGEENHMGLAVAAQTDFGPLRRKIFHVHTWPEVEEFRAALKRNLQDELRARDYRSAIMSGEHCSSRLTTEEEVQWLREFLREMFDDVRIIVYLRRQDEFLLSTYSTDVKGGAVHRLRVPEGDVIERRYDLWNLVSRWANVFGRENVICRKYEKGSLKDGDIVEDFRHVIGLDPAWPYAYPKRLNESLDATSLEFLRLMNKHVPRLTEDGLNKRRGNIVAVLAEVSNGPLLTLPEKALQGFMSRFTDSNRRLAMEYFGGPLADSDDPLFSRSEDERARTTNPDLTVQKAVGICAVIWDEKQAQLEQKQKQIDRTGRPRLKGSGVKGRGMGRPPRRQQPLVG